MIKEIFDILVTANVLFDDLPMTSRSSDSAPPRWTIEELEADWVKMLAVGPFAVDEISAPDTVNR